MKICQCVFSTARPEYLSRTLESQRHLDFTGCDADRIFFDDFPLGRDDDLIRGLANDHGYNEVYLHKENMSIGAVWQEFWDLIRDRGYDFVFHSEDDVVILEPVNVNLLIDFLESASNASQIVLKRQNWYPHEKPSERLPNDLIHGPFRGEFSVPRSYYFTPICSLYSMKHVRFDYVAWYRERYPNEPIFQGANPNEALIGKALLEGFGLKSLHVKNREGKNLIEHIGVYTIGKRLLPHEPGYSTFAKYDPETKYYSTSGKPFPVT